MSKTPFHFFIHIGPLKSPMRIRLLRYPIYKRPLEVFYLVYIKKVPSCLHRISERVKTLWGLPSMDKPYLWEKFWNHLCIGELLWSFMLRSSGRLYLEGIEFFFCMEILSWRAFWGHSDLEVFLRLLQRGLFEFLNENASWKLMSKAKLLRSYIIDDI